MQLYCEVAVRCLALFALLGGLAGCSGGSSGGSQASSGAMVTTFLAGSPVVTLGSSVNLVAYFANGAGIITPGNISVVSGSAISVSPTVTTTYTLTVTGSTGPAANSTVTVNVVAPPSIASFAATPASIAAGETVSLAAIFSNGTGVVTPGNLTITSGALLYVTPSATTTYALTVTNAAGTAVTSAATVTVSPALAQPDLGVNAGLVADWDPSQMFADAMKQARKFGSVSAPYDESATVDALGWPMQDAGVLIVSANVGSWMEGSYALTFTGQATVQAWDDPSVSVGAVAYDSASNTSTATVTVSHGYANLALTFANTRRTQASAVGSGVTNVSLMRPTVNGTSHVAGSLFTDRYLDRLKYFTAIRMMDYLQTNNSTEAVWTDRSIPAYASQQVAPPHASQNVSAQYITGGAYEYAIQLANLTGKDLWLTIPHLAFGGDYRFSSTIWATNLALLLKYGSDSSGSPYTGLSGSSGANPQPAGGPVNPGLNAGLHVYIEYSNEMWSTAGNQNAWLRQQASAAIVARDSDLDWDNDSNQSDVEWRIVAKGVMEIANAFANVYGSAAFGNVYRPVLAGQLANVSTFSGLSYLESRHGGANQYVWAVAGAPYDDFNGDLPGNTMTGAQIVAGMQSYQAANIVPWVSNLAALPNTYHLQGGMLAYEGGQGAIFQTAGSLAAQTMPAMRGVTTTLLDTWFARGGGAFFYYELCAGGTWGLAQDISYDIDGDAGYTANPAGSTEAAPKWGAIKQVATQGQ